MRKARFPFLHSKPATTAAEPGDNVVTSKRQFILNDVLCFINKFHNHPVSVIKSTMMDFYREDELLSASKSCCSMSQSLLLVLFVEEDFQSISMNSLAVSRNAGNRTLTREATLTLSPAAAKLDQSTRLHTV